MSNERYLSAQCSVLGSVLIDERLAGTVIHRTKETDYTGPYRTVYKAMRDVFISGRPVDLTTLAAVLGRDYDDLLRQMMELTPTAANLDVYIDVALEQAQVERAHSYAAALAQCSTLEEYGRIAASINRDLGDRPGVRVVDMVQGLKDFYDRQKSKPEFLPWGIDLLDETVMVERNGDFIVIGGYPSAGKTALSVQMAWTQAKTLKVGYFSLETKPEKLIDRTVTLVSGLDFGSIKRHRLGKDDWLVLSRKLDELTKRNLKIIQAGGLTVADIQALALAGQYDVIYIDYLQLVRADSSRKSDFEQVSQISRDLHTMAQTTGITVVALSQLSRPEKSNAAEKAPGLHSLRQSGQIEQDADAVMLLYKEKPNEKASRRCLKIAKNKEGEAGGILLLEFDGKRQRFSRAENASTLARELSERGKAAKAFNHVRQTSMFLELPVPDADDPWREVNPSDGNSKGAC